MEKRNESVLSRTKSYLSSYILSEARSTKHVLKLPAEIEMAEKIGVSRATLREALSELEQQGLVIRSQGRGTYINRHFSQISKCYSPDSAYVRIIEANGYKPSARYLSRHEKEADGRLSELLEIKEGESLTVLESLYSADGSPCIFNLDYIPTRILTKPFDENQYLSSVFTFLEEQTGHGIVTNYTRISSASSEEMPHDKSGKPYLTSSSSLAVSTIFYNELNDVAFYSEAFYDTRFLQLHQINHKKP